LPKAQRRSLRNKAKQQIGAVLLTLVAFASPVAQNVVTNPEKKSFPYRQKRAKRATNVMSRIPRRYSHFLFGFIQSGLTCAVAAGISSAPFLNSPMFTSQWIKSWIISWAIMTPVVLLAAPVIRYAVDFVTGGESA
jgi:uncharacterized protein DUF2798